ncbi:MAG: cytochrome c biogenesis protein ResB [Gammaproteobacteria bacterium]|nr:cytochrome c biogenesis protein ResB [Gammaproteobacteria bacterium]
MSQTEKTGRRQRRSGAVLLEFLGSMNLAITLLVAIAIASVVGTVLQQNEPYNNYIMKFGPFWFEVFKSLGLFDIYAAPWFLLLLGFLLISTSVCVYRNTPAIIRDMRHFRLGVQEKSLRAFHHRDEWRSPDPAAPLADTLAKRLRRHGYRVRHRQFEGYQMVAAMRGGTSRLGYILSHLSIVVICIGGLLDGNLPLRLAEWRGELKVETRDLAVSQIPPESTLGTDNSSFRGSVTIPEGSRADFVFLGMRDGYLLQKLPFTVALEAFRIEHYPSGMPKSFESDLVIIDEARGEPLRKTIAVNHPWVYKGYAIYQSSFSDGGSRLQLQAWPLDRPATEPLRIDAVVNESSRLSTPRGEYGLEIIDFKPFNVFPVEEAGSKKFNNYGPSVVFKLRAANGEAREYVNYQMPLMVEGRPFLLSGMRATPAEEYRYLHIPLDSDGGIKRFLRFLALAQEKGRISQVAHQQALNELGLTEADPLYRDFTSSMSSLVGLFVEHGIDALVELAEKNVPEEKRNEALSSYIKVVQGVLGTLYVELLREEGVDVAAGIDEQQALYFDEVLNAFSLLGPYGSPLLLRLQQYEHVEASGLQITRAPGQNIVYLGCVMLMAGVFFMFYLHHRRLWLRIEEREGQTHILFAAAAHRERGDFDSEFARLRGDLRHSSSAVLSRI